MHKQRLSTKKSLTGRTRENTFAKEKNTVLMDVREKKLGDAA